MATPCWILTTVVRRVTGEIGGLEFTVLWVEKTFPTTWTVLNIWLNNRELIIKKLAFTVVLTVDLSL